MYKAGLVSVSFRTLSVEEIIAAAKITNLTHIEWGSDIHAPHFALERLQHISSLCQENGISCSYGTYFRFGRDSVERGRAIDVEILASRIVSPRILPDRPSAKMRADDRKARIVLQNGDQSVRIGVVVAVIARMHQNRQSALT